MNGDGKADAVEYRCKEGGGIPLAGLTAIGNRGGYTMSSGSFTALYAGGMNGGGGTYDGEHNTLGLTPGGGWGGAGPYHPIVEPKPDLLIYLLSIAPVGRGAKAGAGVVSTRGPLFRPGGLMNANRYLGLGVGRHNGRAVFRVSGDVVGWFRQNPHLDLKDLGPWQVWKQWAGR